MSLSEIHFIPAPDTLTAPRCWYPTLQQARYELNTVTRHFGTPDTSSTPVPDASVRFGTTSIPVPRTSETSGFPPKTPSVRVYPTERTLGEVSVDYQPFRGSWEKSFESTAVGLLVMLAPQCQPTPSPTKQHTAWYYVSAIPFTAVALFNAVITAFHDLVRPV